MLKLGHDQRGDSIVEVLIAIAIVSLVLVSGYVISNKNAQAIQNNEERVQAQHIVEAQIDALRAKCGLSTDSTCFTSGDCFVGADERDPSDSGSPCDQSQPGSGATYHVAVSGPASNVYTVAVTWTSIGAASNDDSNVTMYYRLD